MTNNSDAVSYCRPLTISIL